MTTSELQKQLDELKLANKQKEAELRKQIAKKKRQEENEFTREVGKLARERFPKLKTLEEFAKLFDKLN